jgi:chromosome segregation ATPase
MVNKFASGNRSVKNETHLVINLKRKVRDLQTESQKRLEEIEGLKRNIRSTRQQEIEVEIKLYMEECVRLRH